MTTKRHIPRELHEAHALVADELEGVIDQALTLEREITVEMFHADEVNEEAALFANWAYKTLHDTIVPLRHVLAVSPVAWLLSLPYAVEILGQTRVDVHSWTEVGTTAIYYKDWETHRVRRSFTCQFHPELMDDIRDIGGRVGPALSRTQGSRRRAAAGPPAVSRDAGVSRAPCRLAYPTAMETGILARTMARPTTLDRTSLLAGVHELAARDRHLARIVDEYGPPPLWARPRGFPTLVRIILEQQVSLASAAALYAKLDLHFEGEVTPARVLAPGEAALLALGVTRQKARYVVGLAAQLESGAVSLERIARMPDAAAGATLVQIPGIGPWTAGVYLLMALRRPDVWPPGDLGLHKSMAEMRGLSVVPTSDEAAAFAMRWRPWRAVAARLLWHSYLSRRAKTWDRQPPAADRQ